ncbi:MAG: hypothetical protein VYD96_06655, partial [Pseudomonadota bacterium]|nr:hypothetical protein [Pseudomonadota bacterium]
MLLSWSRRDKKFATIVTGDNDENQSHDASPLAYTLPSQALDLPPLVQEFFHHLYIIILIPEAPIKSSNRQVVCPNHGLDFRQPALTHPLFRVGH